MGRTRRHINVSRRHAAALTLACAAALLAASSPAMASKGATSSAPVALTPESSKSVTATCPGGFHVSSGGFLVSPGGTPGGGFQSVTQVSDRSGSNAWKVTSGAESTNSASAILTSYARCEKRKDSQIAVPLIGSATIAPGFAQTFNFHCPPQTRPIGAGWSVNNPFNGDISGTSNLIVVQNRRLDANTWTLTAEVRSMSMASSTFTGTVPCEQITRRKLVERSAIATYNEDGRTTASATCRKRTHVVSGGFVISPLPPGTVPFGVVDRHAPVTGRIWRVDLYDTAYGAPAGSALTAYAYCRRNKLKKKRRRARRGGAIAAAPVGPGRVEILPAVALAG